jgi:pimeloyl-ACP methyl ester carboxylesterase
MIERHLRQIDGAYLHFRKTSKVGGVPLVLLHPSPRNSAMFEPMMRLLQDDFDLVAPDTPGYGGSDALPEVPAGIADYLPSLRALLLEVAGPRFMLYGSATGAQLAIAYANSHPGDVAHLFLDNAAHFDPAERQRIVEGYFPDLSPCADGGHLQRAWKMAQQMTQFFPWFQNDEAHRISQRIPAPAEVQTLAMEFLAAGPHYDSAYRAAFEHERAQNVQALKVPTTLFRWLGSVLLRHIDALLAQPLPANLRVVETPLTMPERYAAMRLEFVAAHPSRQIPQP